MASITVWRICLPEYADTAYSGIGAEKFGGRFNTPGHALVYTSESLSLALLEMLVQTNGVNRLSRQICIPAEIDKTSIITYRDEDLPNNWNRIPYTRVTQELGNNWLREEKSLAIRVPSVVVPQEYNCLINPNHPDFESIIIKEPFPVPFDHRLRDH